MVSQNNNPQQPQQPQQPQSGFGFGQPVASSGFGQAFGQPATQAPTAAPQGQWHGISLDPDKAQDLLVDDVAAKVLRVRWEVFTYPDRTDAQGQPIRSLGFRPVYQLASGEQHSSDFFSMGDPDKYRITNEGRTIEVISATQQGASKQSNATVYLRNLKAAGFPGEWLDKNDLSLLDGTEVYLRRVARPERNIDGEGNAAPT